MEAKPLVSLNKDQTKTDETSKPKPDNKDKEVKQKMSKSFL